MDYERWMGLVQHRANLATAQQASSATRATLQTLKERIPAPLAENVASQLPAELGRTLVEQTARAERFGFDEFVERTMAREGTSKSEATFHARAVFDVLSEAVSPGILQKLRDALPPDIERLAQAGASGKL